MEDEKLNNIVVGLNYNSVVESPIEEDVIFVDLNTQEDICHGITIEEAKWLSKTLLEFVSVFEKNSNNQQKEIEQLLKHTYDDGFNDGYKSGFENGKSEGWSKGFYDGYAEGVRQGNV